VSDPQRRKDYLEKIVQIPFLIPEQQPDDLVCMWHVLIGATSSRQRLRTAQSTFPHFLKSEVEACCRSGPMTTVHCSENGIELLQKELREVLPSCTEHWRALRGNPRQIKRFSMR